ncbi:hypothetical protein AKJ37_05930 [candidate division MSBL1 archaeon SCGC-AAA259I09]|uniref:Uncharacterized protein n=2 Tax=candidate division MSBL1 TaxID=215777 RepID=A0A133UPM6_9EURY|nr:hypothetical protein AKJ62_04130 [candidate division MSBL1 archaeon SCGC-AAA259D14]KXA96145.1 hypothetical protein AKJ37_05930 [candidate division MSBL1 archaeon SCGC-AAA259I09]
MRKTRIIFSKLFPLKGKFFLFLIGLITYLAMVSAYWPVLSAVGNPIIAFVSFYGITPFIYGPIVAEFFSLFIGVHFNLPRKIEEHEIDPNFSDPQRFGGFRPLGALIKDSNIVCFVLLSLFGLFFFGGSILSPYPRTFPTTLTLSRATILTIVYLIGWVILVLGFILPSYWLHRHMKSKKEKKKKKLDKKLRKIGSETVDADRKPPASLARIVH